MEAGIARKLEATWDEILSTIHPHPTLSETFSNAAEILSHTITDLYLK